MMRDTGNYFLATTLTCAVLWFAVVMQGGCEQRVVRSTAFDSAQFPEYNTDQAPRYETRTINKAQEKKKNGFFGGLIDTVEDSAKEEEPPPRKPGYRAF